MTLLTPRTLPLAAVALAAVGLGCASIAGDGMADTAADAPVACRLVVEPSGSGYRFAATVTAKKDVAGSYDLTIGKSGRSGSAAIRQAGPFRLAAGETGTLGQATLSGRRPDFDASFTLTIDGQRYRCRDDNAPVDL